MGNPLFAMEVLLKLPQTKSFKCSRHKTHTRKSYPPKRRRTTTMPSVKELICHYRFTVTWDDTGYYLELGNGCASHVHHAKLGPDAVLPARLTRRRNRKTTISLLIFLM